MRHPQKQSFAHTISALEPSIKTVIAVRQELINILHITITTTQRLIRHRNQRFYSDSKRISQDNYSKSPADEEDSTTKDGTTIRAAPTSNRFHLLETFAVELHDTPVARIFH